MQSRTASPGRMPGRLEEGIAPGGVRRGAERQLPGDPLRPERPHPRGPTCASRPGSNHRARGPPRRGPGGARRRRRPAPRASAERSPRSAKGEPPPQRGLARGRKLRRRRVERGGDGDPHAPPMPCLDPDRKRRGCAARPRPDSVRPPARRARASPSARMSLPAVPVHDPVANPEARERPVPGGRARAGGRDPRAGEGEGRGHPGAQLPAARGAGRRRPRRRLAPARDRRQAGAAVDHRLLRRPLHGRVGEGARPREAGPPAEPLGRLLARRLDHRRVARGLEGPLPRTTRSSPT